MTILKHLDSTYQMVFCAFGNILTQHEYEGLIIFFYDEMSDENLSMLLKEFTGYSISIIKNDIPKYYNLDKKLYEDVEIKLNKCGFLNWLNED